MSITAELNTESPKVHPRTTPALTMESLALIDAIETLMHKLPKVSKGIIAPKMIPATPTLALWLEKEAPNFPGMEEFVLGNTNNFIEQSALLVLRLLEEGVPSHIALGFLPFELVSILELRNVSLKPGGTD